MYIHFIIFYIFYMCMCVTFFKMYLKFNNSLKFTESLIVYPFFWPREKVQWMEPWKERPFLQDRHELHTNSQHPAQTAQPRHRTHDHCSQETHSCWDSREDQGILAPFCLSGEPGSCLSSSEHLRILVQVRNFPTILSLTRILCDRVCFSFNTFLYAPIMCQAVG